MTEDPQHHEASLPRRPGGPLCSTPDHCCGSDRHVSLLECHRWYSRQRQCQFLVQSRRSCGHSRFTRSEDSRGDLVQGPVSRLQDLESHEGRGRRLSCDSWMAVLPKQMGRRSKRAYRLGLPRQRRARLRKLREINRGSCLRRHEERISGSEHRSQIHEESRSDSMLLCQALFGQDAAR